MSALNTLTTSQVKQFIGYNSALGRLAERLNAPVLKTGEVLKPS